MKRYYKRLENLNKQLLKLECEACLIEDPISLYYLTGIEMSAGRLAVYSEGASLFVDSRYLEVCKAKSPFPVALSDNGLPLADLFSLLKTKKIKTIGFAADTTSYTKFLQLEKTLAAFNQKENSELVLKSIENPVNRLREIKDKDEIEALKKAADLGSEGFDFACSILKEGILEIDVAIELEIFWKRKESKSLAFDPIIAFGPNSSMPHHRASKRALQAGDTVLIDIGVNLGHYHSDMTRVVYFGNPNPKILEIHEIVFSAQARALTLCKPGTKLADLDKAARGYISETGYGEFFMHGLGHGVGLEIHEAPTIRNKLPDPEKVLEEGMCITIEPGIYLSGIGGVRIEDTVVITKDGHENLTKRPKNPIFIPA